MLRSLSCSLKLSLRRVVDATSAWGPSLASASPICRSSLHWNIPGARCPWSRKSLFQVQSFKGSSFEVNSRSSALWWIPANAELLFLLERRTVRPTNADRPVVLLGVASSRLHHRVTAKPRRKCTQLARISGKDKCFGGSARNITADSLSRATQLRCLRSNCTFEVKNKKGTLKMLG